MKLPIEKNLKRYENEDVRNVHVWTWSCEKDARSDIYLLGGCYIEKDDGVTFSTLFRWLDISCQVSKVNLLVQVKQDPRVVFGPKERAEDLTQLDNDTFNKKMGSSTFYRRGINDGDIVEDGHFIAFQVAHRLEDPGPLNPHPPPFKSKLKVPGTDIAVEMVFPTLRPVYFGSAGRVKGTGKSKSKTYSRNRGVTDTVKRRDQGCRLTLLQAAQRNRGSNFSGMEVAHLVALGDVSRLPVLQFFKDSKFFKQLKLDKGGKAAKKELDKPWNAMVFRSDVHKQFDDFQFGIDANGKVWTFEKGGATSIRAILAHTPNKELKLSAIGAEGGAIIMGEDEELTQKCMEYQLDRCVLMNFSGGGRPRSSNAVNACPITRVHCVTSLKDPHPATSDDDQTDDES